MPPAPLHDKDDRGDLSGRAAVVTGSSRGIGRAIALELARGGADVLVHCRNGREAAAEVAATIGQFGRTSSVAAVDLAQPAGCRQLVEAAWQWRPVDIWVNNAGVDLMSPAVANLDYGERLAAVWAVDVRAAMLLSRLAGARMKAAEGGSIVNIGWDGVESGMEGETAELYAAAKGAVAAFSKSLAHSLAPQVRVNCVAPGWVRTGWARRASDYWQRRAAAESLSGRWGEPDDIARAVRFLASPAARFVNAQVLTVNGGKRSCGD